MGSYDYGKPQVVRWITDNFMTDASILDVGACDGKWRKLLEHYPNVDAVEIFPKNAERIRNMYRIVYQADIADLKYDYYDLIIFGDVIEHMQVEKAQKVLEYARQRCRDMIVGVPFEYKQGILYGNPYEVHIQDDLTPELFRERYKGFEVLVDTHKAYCYYHLPLKTRKDHDTTTERS